MAIDYTSIDEVVNDFQLMIDDTSYDKEAHVYQLRLLALQGLRELKFDVEQEVKTDEKLISSTLKSDLPADFVKLLRVGFKGSDGNFHSLGHNPNLSLDAGVASQVNDGSSIDNDPNYRLDVGKKFGVGGGNNNLGYYRLNRNDNTINFSSDLAGKTVFVEYISDGVSNEMPQDHIIKMSFNGHIVSGDGVKNLSKLRIPNTGAGTAYHNLTFRVPVEGNFLNEAGVIIPFANILSSYDIHISTGDGASTIAQKFTDLINEGYPIDQISPLDTKIKASNNGSEVTLIYSDSSPYSSHPSVTHQQAISIRNSSFSINHDGSDPQITEEHKPLTGDMELVQQGVAGSIPAVHKFCEEALRCYIYYKYVQRKRGIPANEKQMAKRAFFNEKRLARARMMSFSKETALQTSRKAFKQSPKF